jgi:glycosyltransferase involved in cell wall biosynthesis
LKIAVLNRVFASTGGGAERYSMALVEQLSARHDVHVFAQEMDHQWPNVSYHRVSRPFIRPRWLNQLWYAFITWTQTRKGFDIVHSHENVWHGNVQTMHVKTTRRSRFGDRKGVALALRAITTAFSARLITYLLLERARVTLKAGRAVVAVSESLRDELAKEYPASGGMLHVISPGVYLPDHSVSKYQARVALGIQTDGSLLLFVARDYARKGLSALLLALRDMPPEVQLLVAGNTEQISRFRNEGDDFGIGARVHFIGALASAAMAYQAADVLVHPTLEDSFGMVVLEAMAYRLPVIVSDRNYCGAAALCTNLVHALLLSDPQNVTTLRESIMCILNSPELAHRIRENGFCLAQEHSWPATALAYETIYKTVCFR